MLGVGPLELLLIGVVALIVIGPKELPGLMRKVGQFAGTIRRMGADFQRELNKTTGLNEITNLRNSVTQPLKATADAIRKEFNTTTASGAVQPSGAIKPADPKVESVVDEIKAAAGMTPAAAAPVMTPIAKPAETAKAPVKAARPAWIKAPTESTVATADIAPAKKAAPKAKKPIDSPAPVEAIAPAKKTTIKATAPVAKAESVAAKPAAKPAAAKPSVAKPAASKTAAPKAAMAKSTATKPDVAKKSATKKPAAAAKKP